MIDYAKAHFNDSDYVEQMNERIDVESLFNFNIIKLTLAIRIIEQHSFLQA